MRSPLLCVTSTAVLTVATVAILLFFVPSPSAPPAGQVVVPPEDVPSYGFGPRRALLVFNLTAYADGLAGLADVHPKEKRLAAVTLYKNGSVFVDVNGNPVDNVPVAVDQKGGDRPQINLGFEFRSRDDTEEDADYGLLDPMPDTDLEDYFVRGCYLEPSCTRDFAPTVLDVTPQMRGEPVEVLFWQRDVGYTYEGVYGLFAKLKRKFYQKTVPWDAKGKTGKRPCDDDMADIAVVFESEYEREGRDDYNAFEAEVQADMVYPSSSKLAYVAELNASCPDRYDRFADYYRTPNLANHSPIELDLRTFVQMYMASQLLQQVDFGFEGAQQYYYKSPGSTRLSTGPPYDFDSPWDLCVDARVTPDVVTCHGVRPSPLWKALGQDPHFLKVWKHEGPDILRNDLDALVGLYDERIGWARAGYFARHETRWPIPGRTASLLTNFLSIGRWGRPDTVEASLQFQIEWYRRRYEYMQEAVRTHDSFDVRVDWGGYVWSAMRSIWWIPLLCGIVSVVLFCPLPRTAVRRPAPPPPPKGTALEVRKSRI